MKLTKSQFNKVQKYLKTVMPYIEFELTESGQVVESDVRGIDGGFVEIGVETLFDILNELINKR